MLGDARSMHPAFPALTGARAYRFGYPTVCENSTS
jgi:hypothetical protein